jgi:hypothetical protein
MCKRRELPSQQCLKFPRITRILVSWFYLEEVSHIQTHLFKEYIELHFIVAIKAVEAVF